MNIASVLDLAADAMDDRRAVGDITYGELRSAAVSTALNIRARDATATAMSTLLTNSEYLPIALFGSAWAGVSYVPLNFRLPESSLEEMVGRIQPAIMFDKSWRHASGVDKYMEYLEYPENPAVLLFTSGTTSRPKIAALYHQNLMAYVFNTLEFGSAHDDEAVLLAVPPFHIAGVAAVLSATYVGRRIVPLERFDASNWLILAREERVTHAMVVPTMLARIVSELQLHPDMRPPTLRSLAYGGARMPSSVLVQALNLLPNVDFVNAYGLTETSSTVAILGPEDHRLALSSEDPSVRRRLGSCGRPVPGVEFRVNDEELWIRGEQVGGGYLGSTSQIDEDGWLHTGDRGFIDDDGYVFVVERADDMIIRGGENISPTEVEEALLHHPDVASAAVVGLPDLEWGDKIAALVVMKSGKILDVEDLRAWVRDEIGTIKTPELIAAVEELPTGPTGKVLRRSVKEGFQT